MRLVLAIALVSGTSVAHADEKATSPRCPGETGYFYTNYRRTPNPQRGGFVSDTATVRDSPTIVINPQAAVCGNAIIEPDTTLSGTVLVRGDAEVTGSTVTGDVILEGTVEITRSTIKGKGTLASGKYVDTSFTVGAAAAPSKTEPAKPEPKPPEPKPSELADAVGKYISSHARYFTPKDGVFYDGTIHLSQKLKFQGACRITVEKDRDSSRDAGSFAMFYATTFNLVDVRAVIFDYKSPGLSVIQLQMSDREKKASVAYKPHGSAYCRSGGSKGGTDIQFLGCDHAGYNTDTVAAIELPSRKEAEEFKPLIEGLIAACKTAK